MDAQATLDAQAVVQTPSITDQVRQVLPTLGPNDSVTESSGVVTINLTTTAQITMDVINAGVGYVYVDEKAVWQAHIPGITSVVMNISAIDSNGNSQYIVEAAISAETGNALPWDSLSPWQAWKQYNLTWLYGEPGLNGNS